MLAAMLGLLNAGLVRGAAPSPNDVLAPTADTTANNVPLAQEFDAETSYDGGSEMKQGNLRFGSVGNINSHVNYVVSPQLKEGLLLRVGFDAERNSFELPARAVLPNTLQSVNAVIGADIAVNDQILVRAEAHPGIYSDFVNVSGSDFDVPVQIGGTYLWSDDFQIIAGLQIDLKSNLPIIGAPGFRWKFADKWVISAIPPRPQLQFELTNSVTLYVGAEILGGTYHLNNNFGSNHGNPPLNNNICDFNEDRVGTGVTWKFTPNLSLDVSGGYVAYREFNMHPDHIGFDVSGTEFHNNIGDGAPYGEIGIRGSF